MVLPSSKSEKDPKWVNLFWAASSRNRQDERPSSDLLSPKSTNFSLNTEHFAVTLRFCTRLWGWKWFWERLWALT